jgi:hypothetical protein
VGVTIYRKIEGKKGIFKGNLETSFEVYETAELLTNIHYGTNETNEQAFE